MYNNNYKKKVLKTYKKRDEQQHNYKTKRKRKRK